MVVVATTHYNGDNADGEQPLGACDATHPRQIGPAGSATARQRVRFPAT